MNIAIRLVGLSKVIPMKVEDWYAVCEVKKRLEGQTGCRIDQQKLIFNQKILEDSRALSDYDIKNDDILLLQLFLQDAFHVFVRFSHSDLKLEVTHSDTIASIKSRFQKEKGIFSCNQVLWFKKELKDCDTLYK